MTLLTDAQVRAWCAELDVYTEQQIALVVQDLHLLGGPPRDPPPVQDPAWRRAVGLAGVWDEPPVGEGEADG